MAANDEYSFIANNQGGLDLLHNSYILPFLRKNKDESHNYKCRHRVLNEFNISVPCPASTTLLNNKIIRSNRNHNHAPLSNVAIQSKKALINEKELAATSRRPLNQIHSEVHSKLVNELTKGIDKTNISELDDVLNEVSQVFPDYINVKSGLAKIRSQTHLIHTHLIHHHERIILLIKTIP